MSNTKKFHYVSCVFYTMLCMVWIAKVGIRFTWDFNHYHLYVAHAWWQNRLPEELFAAGAQGYLNPFPHLPFYFAYLSGASTFFVSLLMAWLHSINLWLLHFVACQLIAPSSRIARLAIFCAVVLGFLSPGFLFEVGGSYADIITSIPALGSLAALLFFLKNEERDSDRRLVYLAGFLSGISLGLKPSSLIFCVAVFFATLFVLRKNRLTFAWQAIFSSIFGAVLVGGRHALMLWDAFSNPVFPLFNGYFSSDWFFPVNIVSERFRPDSWRDVVMLPLSMADSAQRTGFEAMTVDIRPIWLLGLVMAALAWKFLRYISGRSGYAASCPVQRMFWVVLLLFTPLWAYSSNNIRYAVPFLLLLGPAISLLVLKLETRRPFFPIFVLLLPIVAQGALASNLNTPNIAESDEWGWDNAWISLSVPPPLNKKAAYYLSLQRLSYGSFAVFFPPESRFFNLEGFSPGGKVFRAVQSLAKSNNMSFRTLRVLTSGGLAYAIEEQNSRLSDYGYRVNENDCQLIKSPVYDLALVSCAVEASQSVEIAERSRREMIDQRINYWERKCPRVFSPPGQWSTQTTRSRYRYYPSSDFVISEKKGELIALTGFKSNAVVHLESSKGERLLTTCPEINPE